MSNETCAIFKTKGLARNFNYQVFAAGPGEFKHPTHPEYEYFIGATETRREARKLARNYLDRHNENVPVEICRTRKTTSTRQHTRPPARAYLVYNAFWDGL